MIFINSFRVWAIKLMVLWFSHSWLLDFLGMAMKTDLSISEGIWPVWYKFLKRLNSTSTPSSCKAVSISTTTSSGPAAFPVLQCCNADWTSSFNIEGPDSYETVLSSSSLSSWNKEAMYSSQRFAISSGSHKIRPPDGRVWPKQDKFLYDNIWQSVAQNDQKTEKQIDFKHVVAALLVLS